MGDYSDFCEMHGSSANDPDFLDNWLAEHASEDYENEDRRETYWYVQSKTTNSYEILENHLTSVTTLIELHVPRETIFSLTVMLHGHLVSAIEGYLAGVFIYLVTNSDDLTRKLIESDPEFAKRTFSLKEIFEKHSSLKLTVATYLKNIIFHDIKKINLMYKNVIGHDFSDISWLYKAVITRHDCVHRAGYDKKGNKVDISKESILELLENIKLLAASVEKTVSELDYN